MIAALEVVGRDPDRLQILIDINLVDETIPIASAMKHQGEERPRPRLLLV
jgi:hypothetical protein